jgi:replicative DNA helicase
MPEPAAITAAREAIERTAASEKVWPEPISLDQPELPLFPVDVFPPWLRDYVEGLAAETETPVDLAAMLALAVLATCAQRRTVTQIRPRYTEQMCLWILALLESAERKSTVYARMLQPIYDRQDELIEHARPERGRLKAAIQTAEKRLKNATDNASKKNGQDAIIAACERDEAADDLERLKNELPPEPVLLGDDITPEAFNLILGEVGCITLASCEGGLFGPFFGLYNNKQPQIDSLLKSHNGDSATTDRVGSGKTTIRDPASTLALAVQPDVLREISEKQAWVARGGMGRFAFSVPAGKVGRRLGDAPEMPDRIVDAYNARVLALLPSEPPMKRGNQPANPRVMKFTTAARRQWEAFAAELEPRLHQHTGDLGWFQSWGGKLAGLVARIAALLQFAEHGASDVEVDAVKRAIRLAAYLEAHAVAAMMGAGENQAMKDARQLLRWIRKEQVREFTERDAYRVNFGSGRPGSKERAAASCRVADDAGWIRPLDARSDSGKWESHPALLESENGVSAVSADFGTHDVSSELPSTTTFPMVEPNTKNGARPETTKHADTADTSETEAQAKREPDPADNEPRFEPMPDVELDQIARLTTHQIIDQEHRDRKKNGNPAEPLVEAIPQLPAEAFVEHAKALPFVEDEESFTAEPVDWVRLEAEEAEADQ